MRLKINQVIRITEKRNQGDKRKIPLMEAVIKGRVDCESFRKYYLEEDGTSFWLTQEGRIRWILWSSWDETTTLIIGKGPNGENIKTKGHPVLYNIETMEEGTVDGKGENRKIIRKQNQARVKQAIGHTEKIRNGSEMEYTNGNFLKRNNSDWPLFSLEIWRHPNRTTERRYFLGTKVTVDIVR